MDSRSIRNEYYDGTMSLDICLQRHTSFCLLHYFDQILETDRIKVTCCNCNAEFTLEYQQIATKLMCQDCEDIEVSSEHLEKLKIRLKGIQTKLTKLK